jgi:hypothetical protein
MKSRIKQRYEGKDAMRAILVNDLKNQHSVFEDDFWSSAFKSRVDSGEVTGASCFAMQLQR